MKPEKQRTRGAPRSKRLSLSRLFCFNASQVNDSDAPTRTPDRERSSWSACFMAGEARKRKKTKKEVPVHSPAKPSAPSRPARAVEESRPNKSDRERSSWSACFMVGEARKRKRKGKEVPVHSPAKPSAPSRPARAVEESLPNKSSGKRGTEDNNNNAKNKAASSSREASKFDEDLNIGQQHLELQTKRKDYSNVAQASFVQSLYPIPTRLKDNEPRPYKIVSQSRKLGSSVGVGIMTITLAILVFVGRGSAIICLCSCLYISQLVKASQPNDEEKIAPKKIHIDSAEYKKKVMLEGFLERNGGRPKR
ncbi:uncharacterized protein LOC122052882 isoform X2 [Zingiber officinale]|uniref:uncharacterized protein LOC122052882 isoform X2 n=1 Tax=Zingiber officinale TaxID=94328 RepID=UPI001C4D7435|nr:uncharacterized protein LOC122052882 isoform X2 [Zingiber officinale]